MAHVSKEFNNQPHGSNLTQPRLGPYPIAAATKIFKGTLVVLDANGRMTNPGVAALEVIGVAVDTYDNSAGAAGAIVGEADTGLFIFDAAAANAPVAGPVAKGYASSNHEITTDAASGSGGVLILGVEGTKVTVNVGLSALAAAL